MTRISAPGSTLGPFFSVHSHLPGADPVPPWRPLRELAEQPEPLLRRIGAVRTALASRTGRAVGQVELRVAASITHLGLAARLIAPALAGTACHHQMDMRLAGLWWQDELGGPAPLSIPASHVPAGGHGRSHDAPEGDECYRLLDEVIAPITSATSRLASVSDRVLWGNVASAVNSAASQVIAQRPDLASRAQAAALGFFGHPRLDRERRPPGPAFRRSSCCLLYRLTLHEAEDFCGDCLLLGPSGGRRARR